MEETTRVGASIVVAKGGVWTTFPISTSASEVWDTRGGVEQRDGIGELGSRTGGIPDASDSSTGNRVQGPGMKSGPGRGPHQL